MLVGRGNSMKQGSHTNQARLVCGGESLGSAGGLFVKERRISKEYEKGDLLAGNEKKRKIEHFRGRAKTTAKSAVRVTKITRTKMPLQGCARVFPDFCDEKTRSTVANGLLSHGEIGTPFSFVLQHIMTCGGNRACHTRAARNFLPAVHTPPPLLAFFFEKATPPTGSARR